MIKLHEKEQLVADILVEAAIGKRTISFSEIMERAHTGRNIGHYLSSVGHKCIELGLPIVTVLVVYKGTDKVGKGYVEFEPTFSEHPELAEAEMKRVWANSSWNGLSSFESHCKR